MFPGAQPSERKMPQRPVQAQTLPWRFWRHSPEKCCLPQVRLPPAADGGPAVRNPREPYALQIQQPGCFPPDAPCAGKDPQDAGRDLQGAFSQQALQYALPERRFFAAPAWWASWRSPRCVHFHGGRQQRTFSFSERLLLLWLTSERAVFYPLSVQPEKCLLPEPERCRPPETVQTLWARRISPAPSWPGLHRFRWRPLHPQFPYRSKR